MDYMDKSDIHAIVMHSALAIETVCNLVYTRRENYILGYLV